MDEASAAGDALLSAWLNLNSTLWNTRMVAELTYNEAHVLGILYRHRDDDAPMTATALIRRTHLLKSQMNRVLTGLEQTGLIEREQAARDKRLRYITLTRKGEEAYLRERTRIDELIVPLIEQLGAAQALHIAGQMNAVTAALEDILIHRTTDRHAPRAHQERT